MWVVKFIMETIDFVELEKARVELLRDNLVRIIIRENSELDENDILKINDAKSNFVKEKAYTVVFVAPKAGNITRKARELSASEKVTKNAICKAIVAPSKVSKVIGNFFINYLKPAVPIKVFSDEKSALQWITGVKNNPKIALKN